MTVHGLPYATIIGKVSGGAWASSVIDRIEAEGRYGVKLGQTWRDAEARPPALHRRRERSRPVPARAPRDGGADRREVLVVARRRRTTRCRSASRRVVHDVLGREPELAGEPYGADMRLLVNEGNTPTVIFGPGDKRVAHSADEWVSLDEVADCARALAAWLVRELIA